LVCQEAASEEFDSALQDLLLVGSLHGLASPSGSAKECLLGCLGVQVNHCLHGCLAPPLKDFASALQATEMHCQRDQG
jgi:hypothetical protein